MISRSDRATWPEVLNKQDMAAIWGCSQRTLDRKRRSRLLPQPIAGSERRKGQKVEWSKADVCRWLDRPESRRCCRRAA